MERAQKSAGRRSAGKRAVPLEFEQGSNHYRQAHAQGMMKAFRMLSGQEVAYLVDEFNVSVAHDQEKAISYILCLDVLRNISVVRLVTDAEERRKARSLAVRLRKVIDAFASLSPTSLVSLNTTAVDIAQAPVDRRPSQVHMEDMRPALLHRLRLAGVPLEPHDQDVEHRPDLVTAIVQSLAVMEAAALKSARAENTRTRDEQLKARVFSTQAVSEYRARFGVLPSSDQNGWFCAFMREFGRIAGMQLGGGRVLPKIIRDMRDAAP